MRTQLTRRRFLQVAVAVTASAGGVRKSFGSTAKPLKLGIRAASMKMVGTPEVFAAAASIPGIRGVELQTTAGKVNLRDPDNVRLYKKEAERCSMKVPSLAGIWDRGVKIHSPGAADSILASLRAAETLGAGVILAAFFRDNAPDMNDESSYGPVVAMLQKVAPKAADVGVTIGLENSLSPTDNKKLVDLVDHPAVGVYYDLHNMDHYGHGAQAVPGIELLGKKRICMVHVKNGNNLIEEPGPIDWPAAFREFNQIGYDGWYLYESSHDNTQDCIEDTKKNNQYLQKLIP